MIGNRGGRQEEIMDDPEGAGATIGTIIQGGHPQEENTEMKGTTAGKHVITGIAGTREATVMTATGAVIENLTTEDPTVILNVVIIDAKPSLGTETGLKEGILGTNPVTQAKEKWAAKTLRREEQ